MAKMQLDEATVIRLAKMFFRRDNPARDVGRHSYRSHWCYQAISIKEGYLREARGFLIGIKTALQQTGTYRRWDDIKEELGI